ncbi:Protein of unknown function [Cotesia congregata]|uniref:Uncharacterized protein n=1 Tax=Cotesia congregata TaxID=51543 RepID=A0A8J2MJ10_COTCN|nr:Protein of unknown function [Cotesia congregata]
MITVAIKILLDISVGDCVPVNVDKVDRSSGDPQNIIAVITDFKNGGCQVDTVAGLIKSWFSKSDLKKASSTFIKIDQVNQSTFISLREAVAALSLFNGQGFVKCSCQLSKTQCKTNRCLCFKSKQLCDVVCRDLFFDKTDNFGGYIAKIGAQYVVPYISYSTENGVKRLEGFDYEIVKLLFGKLNIIISFGEKDIVILKTYNKEISQYLLMQLENRTIDFAVNSIVLRGYPNQLEVTYVFYQTGLSVITQYREIKKIVSYLFSFLPFHVIAMLFITSIVIFFLLQYLLRDPYSRNLIDILRVFLNLPIPTLPSTIRGRILFGITLISFTVANMVIQSHMNTVLVSSNAAQNVEDLNDLIHLNYRVYTRGKIGDDLKNAGVSKIVEVQSIINCSKLEEKEAFASKEISLLPMRNENCHIPRKPIIPGKFLVYYMRRNWPIFPRINKRLLMLFEGGLTNYHIEKILEKYQQLVQEPDQYQVNLTEHCFSDIKASVLITDFPSNALLYDLFTSMTQSVSFLDKSRNYNIPTNQNTPIPWIILVLTSPIKFKDVLDKEAWRDFNQFFIILDGGDTNNGCVNAHSFLMEAWENDILNVVFLCVDHRNQASKLFSFNPFTSSVPMSWEKVSVVPAINGHPWTLLSRNFNPDAGCRDIFFTKVKNLGGYHIKAGYFLLPPYVYSNKVNGVAVLTGDDYKVMQVLTNKLNATLVYKDKSAEYWRPSANKNGNLFTWEEFHHKTLDFRINIFFLKVPSIKFECMYSFHAAKATVITKYCEFTAFGGHIFTFLPLSIAALFLVTSLFVFMLLRYIFKDPYSRDFIDIFRVYLNLPLPRSPILTRGRIVFGVTLVSFTVSNIVIQSHMNMVMASKNVARNVETIGDFIELNYTVLATSPYLIDELKASGIKNVLRPKDLNCSNLKNNEAVVASDIVIHSMMAKGCYVPKQPFLTGALLTYHTRRNFPIFPKLNHNLIMLFESGFTEPRLGHPKSDKQESVEYEVITMAHMEYVFYAYMIFNFFSLIVFIVEAYILHD